LYFFYREVSLKKRKPNGVPLSHGIMRTSESGWPTVLCPEEKGFVGKDRKPLERVLPCICN